MHQLLVVVLHVAEEDVPDDGDAVDVEDPVLGRDVDKVDVLGWGPDAPVKLREKDKSQLIAFAE